MLKRLVNWFRIEWVYWKAKRQLNHKGTFCPLCNSKLEVSKSCQACVDCLGIKDYENIIRAMLKREQLQRLQWNG